MKSAGIIYLTARSRPLRTPRATTIIVMTMNSVCQASRRSGSATSAPKMALT